MKALLVIALGAWTAAADGPRVVVVSESPEEPTPGPVETASDQYRLRLGGLFEGALGRDPYGNAVGLPRMRVRAEALVSLQLEVGMVAELDLSPWSSANLKEDGPGPVRDLYGRMSLGNKKLLDLGEARLGYLTVPILLEQSVPMAEMLFLTGSLGREAWLPGRELAATYAIGAHRYGWPIQGTFGLVSGVKSPLGAAWFTPAQEPHAGSGESAPAAVPLTAGNTYSSVSNPGLSGRVEGQPLLKWLNRPFVTVGAGALARPLATGADARLALAVDAELRWTAITGRVAAMAVDTQRAPILDGKSFMAEAALEVLPDFLDVRARYDVAFGGTQLEAHRLSVGSGMFYIDGAAPSPLTAENLLPMATSFGRSFSILWLRTYDLGRYSRGRGYTLPSRNNSGEGALWFLGESRYLLTGDVDQLVVRVAF